MYCNNVRCVDRGYCSCHDDSTAEAAGGCGGLLIIMFVGIFAAFLYPAIRISRANFKYEANGSPKFAGAVWLLTSPLFGFLAMMLYQVVFALGACAAEALQSKITNLIYIAGTFLIYALAMGLAVIAFLIKNRAELKAFVTEPVTRSVGKAAVLVGLLLITTLTILSIVGVVFTAADGYFTVQNEIANKGKKENQLISDETGKFDSYVGTYKLTTRSERELFVVTKNSDGKSLRLSINDVKTQNAKAKNGKAEKAKKTDDFRCLLTPNIEGNSAYYFVSECVADGKQSPLGKVYFDNHKGKVTMSFVYNVRSNGDTLVKIK